MSPIEVTYAVTYSDFLRSLHQYRRRSKWSAFVYCLDVWLLPLAGAAVGCTYLFGLVTHNLAITYATDYLAIIGLLALVGLPLLYRLRLRKTYNQRTTLAESGQVRLIADSSSLQLQVNDKVHVSYEWAAFSDYSEDRQVLTLFVKTAAFHTVPLYALSPADSQAVRAVVSAKVRRY